MEKRIAAERCISSALALYWGVTVERTTSGRYEESTGAQQVPGLQRFSVLHKKLQRTLNNIVEF
jgi:hypothetical protein